jgi:hypothetical protein
VCVVAADLCTRRLFAGSCALDAALQDYLSDRLVGSGKRIVKSLIKKLTNNRCVGVERRAPVSVCTCVHVCVGRVAHRLNKVNHWFLAPVVELMGSIPVDYDKFIKRPMDLKTLRCEGVPPCPHPLAVALALVTRCICRD